MLSILEPSGLSRFSDACGIRTRPGQILPSLPLSLTGLSPRLDEVTERIVRVRKRDSVFAQAGLANSYPLSLSPSEPFHQGWAKSLNVLHACGSGIQSSHRPAWPIPTLSPSLPQRPLTNTGRCHSVFAHSSCLAASGLGVGNAPPAVGTPYEIRLSGHSHSVFVIHRRTARLPVSPG